MCSSARAGVAARTDNSSRASGFVRMESYQPRSNIVPLGGGQEPHPGQTVARLCWDFVKHPETAKNGRRTQKLSTDLSTEFSTNFLPIFPWTCGSYLVKIG